MALKDGIFGPEGFSSDPRLMRCILDDMPIGLVYGKVIVDAAGKPIDLIYLEMNKACEVFMQGRKSDLIDRPVTELFPMLKDDLPVNLEPFARAAMDGETVQFDRRWLVTDLWYSVTVYGPKKGYFVAMAEDISERRKTEEDLRRSNEDLKQFAYIASHDLQEPLRTMVGYMSLLEKRRSDALGPDGIEYVRSALSGGERMRALINDLLEFSKVERDRNPAFVDMNEVAESVVLLLNAPLEESGGKVSIDPLPSVMADRSQMSQVLQNLIGNAIKFHGPEPPMIHVKATPGHGEWIFAVEDNGIGFNMEHKERIFQVFQKLHTKDCFAGTGVGLAIVKKIIEGLNGKVWAESQEGKGTTFYFSIPRTADR